MFVRPERNGLQAGERPVLVVSAEPINRHYAVVMVVPITSRKNARPARLGEVLLPAGIGGLLRIRPQFTASFPQPRRGFVPLSRAVESGRTQRVPDPPGATQGLVACSGKLWLCP